MSYILEALKKAQAERQLGSAPTIHAPQAAVPAAPGAGASRKPLLVGLGAGALVVVAGALLLWRQQPAAPVSASVPASAPVSAPTAGASAVAHGGAVPAVHAPDKPADTLAVSAPVAPAAAAGSMPEPSRAADAAAAAPRTTAADAAPARSAEPASVPAPASPRARAAAAADMPVAASAVAARVPSPAAPAPAPEDSLPYLRQLPDAQQRDIPRVTFGGYMYSANPSDRLLLVDKALRHEGEEVAPGLVLEKLLPKAAVMNYRGTRYRVAY